ncbi:MAG TPA: tetratricopeptide repeat protein, partial [Phototrophicaceae bacterium]|nr:tetratricopeptide repeat protein [Phototrophicaceae bacterium]
SYETALALEPTWDLGWRNLAALQARQGDYADALTSVTEAVRINPLTDTHLNRAVLAEDHDALPRTAVVTSYTQAIYNQTGTLVNRLPLSTFWVATPIREEALDQYWQTAPQEIQYRIAAVHYPERLPALIPATPVNAQDWWVMGEYALTVKSDPAAAVDAFTQAIALDRINGDYYTSRARAELITQPDAAIRDLKLARLLGTKYEYPDAVRAELVATPEEALKLRAGALPAFGQGQEFAAVLYGGRVSNFDLLPELRSPGPGRAAMQPWYTIAAQYETDGDLDGAVRVYRAILSYAPDENEARERLTQLAP